MRIVTETVVRAFINRKKCTVGNTYTDGTTLYLHRNAIARWTDKNELLVCSAGWETRTTKERLNGLFSFINRNDLFISQKNWVWYLGNTAWPDTREWILIK